jgi:hypothetical protein
MMKRALIPLSLLAVVAILSGCQLPGGGVQLAGSNGIIIRDFGFDYSPIYAEETTGLTLTLQNVGGEEGTLQEITIFGVDAPAAAAGPLTWGYGTGDTFTLTPTDVLLPPDPTTGFEGEEYYQEWVPEAPIDIKSATTYEFQTRVKYTYSSTFTGKIQVVHNDYLRTLPAEEREALIKAGGVQDASVTGGPLSLAAASGRHFIIRAGDPAQLRSIKFKITNVGSGFPYKTPWGTANLHYVTVTSDEGDITCSAPQDIKLARGKTGVISCDFTSPADGTFTNKVDKYFSVTLDYGYYVDSAASITVNPILD